MSVTTLEVDAILNATNISLKPFTGEGGGGNFINF